MNIISDYFYSNDMVPKVSIIVPIYNSEKFLDKCIGSLVNQTLKDIEIILVSDASPDNSKEIMERYAKEDNRIITIYNKENGCPNPRNAGIKAAKGKYLGFVDADDWVSEDMYEKLYLATQHESIDVAVSDIMCQFSSGKTQLKINIDAKAFENTSEVKSYVAQYGGALLSNIWKRDMITDDLLFLDHCLYSDSIVIAWYMKASSYAKVSEPLYQYYFNDQSITHTKNNFRYFDRCWAAMDMLERSKENGLYISYQEEIDYAFYCLYYRNTLYFVNNVFTKIPIKKLNEILENYRNLVNVKGNKYYNLHKSDIDNRAARIFDFNFFCGVLYLWLIKSKCYRLVSYILKK